MYANDIEGRWAAWSYPVKRLEECLSFLLGKAYQTVNQDARPRLAPHGVTPVQYALLRALWEADGQSGAELSTRLQLDAPTITGLLDRLVRSGLVQRRPDPIDRRVNRLFLTPRGRQLRVPLDRVMDEVNAEFVVRLGARRAEALWKVLGRLGGTDYTLPPGVER